MNSSTLFWGIAVLFIVMALAFLLPPLLRGNKTRTVSGRRNINIAVYRDQLKELEADLANGLLSRDQFDEAKVELEARLAADAIETTEDAEPVRRGGRALGYTLGALLPVLAIGFYMVTGNPQAIDAIAAPQPQASGEHDIMKMIQQIEDKTRSEPQNGEAWTMLAKTYAVVGHWPEALKAYEKAVALRPEVPAVMTGYAEALAIANGRILQGRPMEIVLKALEKDPEDMKGLELAGISHFQDRNYAQAAYYFKRLLKLLPPESPYTQDISEALKEAKRLSEGGLTGLDNLSNPGDAGVKGPTISGKVDIAPALKGRLGPNDVVFLFARPPQGGAPAAAIRAKAGDFPLEFELTDAMAMSPENRLSNYKTVTLTARVAKSGDVKGVPGDLEGKLEQVKVGANGIVLVIDKVRD